LTGRGDYLQPSKHRIKLSKRLYALRSDELFGVCETNRSRRNLPSHLLKKSTRAFFSSVNIRFIFTTSNSILDAERPMSECDHLSFQHSWQLPRSIEPKCSVRQRRRRPAIRLRRILIRLAALPDGWLWLVGFSSVVANIVPSFYTS
jgi:hypothetical protein